MKRLFFPLFALLALACSGTPYTQSESGSGGDGPQPAAGQLVADGDSDGTYRLITSCGYNYETSDTSNEHAAAPFQHIRQSWDAGLGKYVFDFYIHAQIDDDRGKADVRDRQRNEIKTDGHSPASMVGQQGETLRIRWKFRLPEGMLTTNKFCHVHQIKGIDNAAGTADVGNPLITFTARTLSNGKQQFQVIFVGPTADKTGNVYLARADLAELLGEWVEVEEQFTCGMSGSYSVRVRRLSDGREVVALSDAALKMWREGTTGLRPKWGIYRSVGADGALRGALRDEVLRFADFSIEKVAR